MSANIAFYAGENFAIQDLAGSGLGFYGDAGFAASVKVGFWQGRTFITNANGTTQGPEVDNIKYLNDGSGVIGQTGSGVGLTSIPNYQASLNPRFTYDTPVKVQNAQFRIYDRSNVDVPAVGVTTKLAELIHPDTNQGNSGSGDTIWITAGGSASILSLANSPGSGGLYAGNGSNSTRSDTQHDWYIAMSASPDTIGSKTSYAGLLSLEFL